MANQNFTLTDSQTQKLNDWVDHCNTNAGTIGGRLTYEFTPNGLGVALEVRCLCGERLVLTEFETW